MAQRVVIPGFRKIETSGSGEGGTSNYNELTNKPSINNVPLVGNLNTVDLKLTDPTLTEEGVPAEAKVVGDKLEEQATSLTALSEQLGSHTVKSNVPENAVFTDTVYDDTEVQKRISNNGYGEVAGGKNLAKSYESTGTASQYIEALFVDVNLKPSTTYTISFVGVSNYTGYPNEFLFTSANPFRCNGERQSIKLTTKESLPEDQRVYTRWLIFKNSDSGIIPSFTDVQIEIGSEATEYEPYFPSNKMLMEEKADKTETTVNLFKPTLETTTVNGITVTNNGDGTYNVTGTATATTELTLGSVTLTPGIYKNIGATAYIKKTDGSYIKTIHNEEFTITEDSPVVNPILFCNSGEAISGTIIIKPMITTNLNATIDDFVPYTGDTGSLNGDLADLRGDVDGFGDEFVTRRIQLVANHTADYYRYIEPIRGRDQILTPPIIVNGTSASFDSSGSEDQISGNNYSYAHKNSVKMDILDAEISSSITQAGVTVKYIDKKIDDYKYYDVRGTATSDIEIPLYSVTNPKNDYLYFITNSVSKMSSDTFYIKISDASGKETTLGFDDSKKVNTHLKPGGKVTVYLVVKSGIKVNKYVNVKCGYSSSYCIADFSASKYSDTIDNVLDAIFDLNSRLKALENK